MKVLFVEKETATVVATLTLDSNKFTEEDTFEDIKEYLEFIGNVSELEVKVE